MVNPAVVDTLGVVLPAELFRGTSHPVLVLDLLEAIVCHSIGR